MLADKSDQDAGRDWLSPEVDDAHKKANLVPHHLLLWLQLPGCQLLDTVSQRWPASCGSCCAFGCIISSTLHGGNLHVIMPTSCLPQEGIAESDRHLKMLVLDMRPTMCEPAANRACAAASQPRNPCLTSKLSESLLS